MNGNFVILPYYKVVLRKYKYLTSNDLKTWWHLLTDAWHNVWLTFLVEFLLCKFELLVLVSIKLSRPLSSETDFLRVPCACFLNKKKTWLCL